MNFYFSLKHLVDVIEHSTVLVENLASQTIRSSPRNGQANRNVLEQCNHLLLEACSLIKRKMKIEKTALRRPTILFRALELSFQRVLNLASAGAEINNDTPEESVVAWKLLFMAQQHYRILKEIMDDLTGVSFTLASPKGIANGSCGFLVVLRKEAVLQQETSKLIEKATQVFGEREDVMGKLYIIRKDLIDARRKLLNMISDPSD